MTARGRSHPCSRGSPLARKVLGWPKQCKFAHAFLWEYSYKRLKLARLLGKLGVFLTLQPMRNLPLCAFLRSIGCRPQATQPRTGVSGTLVASGQSAVHWKQRKPPVAEHGRASLSTICDTPQIFFHTGAGVGAGHAFGRAGEAAGAARVPAGDQPVSSLAPAQREKRPRRPSAQAQRRRKQGGPHDFFVFSLYTSTT